MLFLPESVYKTRRALHEDIERGKLTSEQGYRRMLEVDPADHIALLEVGRSRRQAGDLAGAEECFWHSAQAQPCCWPAYLDLAQLLAGDPEQMALSQGLAELAFRKVALDAEAIEHLEAEPVSFGFEGVEGLKDLGTPEQLELAAEALRHRRDLEPAAVTARLRPYRLIHQLQEAADLDAQFVDVMVGQGQSIVPLLVGVLRGWGQALLPEDDERTVENALALLGEIGDASVIPHLLEFIVRDNIDLSGAAAWAFERIVELHPTDAARVIGEIAPSLSVQERIAVAERLLRHPILDGSGALFARLSENLNKVPKQDLEEFFPVLLTVMVAARGRPGLELARAALRQNRDRLPRKTRGECEGLIEALGVVPRPSLPAKEPSPWTVYDICAGNATWEELDEEGEDAEEEDFLPPEPARRTYTPGRNDPCWCGSGKKYKKCHLDADQGAGHPDAPALRGEFDGLRRKLGDFLAKAVPKSDTRLAWIEFFGDTEPEDKGVASLADWMMHDWIPPGFGHTVIEEYLHRHGSHLTEREREMAESWSGSFVGLYEVQEVRVGTGVEVKDLLADRVSFVHDVSLSKHVVRWDGLMARVVDGERGLELTGVGVAVPRLQLEPLKAWMQDDRRRTGLAWPEYLKRNLPRIRRRPAEIGAEWISSLQLCNSDREELLFSKAVYRVLDEPALTGALDACPEMSADEPGQRYTWLKGSPGEEGRTVLGSIRLAGGELTFECNSKPRHERAKKLLSSLAGRAVRHLRDEFTTQQQMKRRALEEPRAAEAASEIPPEVRQQVVTEYMERHFAAWPDMKLPALGGKTPREAVKTAAGRQKVSALLRDFQNAEEHKRRNGEPHYDISRLRAELGLEE